ncbi:hypothetical protein [Ferrovibrio sp.]|uniref:hypothetical protein n=1 Tax=Ferrovibrio sp. TaxID=1917215 RepID=UPI003514AA79
MADAHKPLSADNMMIGDQQAIRPDNEAGTVAGFADLDEHRGRANLIGMGREGHSEIFLSGNLLHFPLAVSLRRYRSRPAGNKRPEIGIDCQPVGRIGKSLVDQNVVAPGQRVGNLELPFDFPMQDHPALQHVVDLPVNGNQDGPRQCPQQMSVPRVDMAAQIAADLHDIRANQIIGRFRFCLPEQRVGVAGHRVAMTAEYAKEDVAVCRGVEQFPVVIVEKFRVVVAPHWLQVSIADDGATLDAGLHPPESDLAGARTGPVLLRLDLGTIRPDDSFGLDDGRVDGLLAGTSGANQAKHGRKPEASKHLFPLDGNLGGNLHE